MNATTSTARAVAVPGGTMAVHHHDGTGPALVFLHYWGGSAATWSLVQERLAGRAMIAWDQRGWGAQAALPGPFGLAALADDVESVAGSLGHDEIVIVGHSQGGKVAQLVARRRPPWLRGLVLVAPAPPRPAGWITPAYAAQLAHAYDTPESVAAALDTVLTSTPLPPRLREQTVRDSTSAGPDARVEWPLRGITADLGPGVVDVATTVAVGEDDRVEPPEALRDLLLPTLPASTPLRIAPGAGHLLPLEAPDFVADTVEEGLARLA